MDEKIKVEKWSRMLYIRKHSDQDLNKTNFSTHALRLKLILSPGKGLKQFF